MLVALAGVRVRWWLVELGESPLRLVVSAERLTGSEHLLAMNAMEQRLAQAAPKVYIVMRGALDFSVRVNARPPTTAVMVLERILAGWEHDSACDTVLRRDPDKEPERLWWGVQRTNGPHQWISRRKSGWDRVA
jgi:hypothetical protein